MFKAAVICALLCFVAIIVYSDEKERVIFDWSRYEDNSYTIISKPSLEATSFDFIRVSKNVTHWNVISSDEKFKTCALKLDPANGHWPLKAVSFDQDKIIVQTFRDLDLNKKKDIYDHTFDYTFLIFDLHNCSYKSVQLPKSYEKVKPFSNFLPEVITYTDSFDIFLPSLNVCAPCRFTKDGNQIDLEYQVDPSIIVNGTDRRIEQAVYIKAIDQGYVFVYSSEENDTTAIKLLDHDFKVIREKIIVNVEIHGIALDNQSADKIGICLSMPRRKALYHGNILPYVDYNCTLFDSELNLVYSNILPLSANQTTDTVNVLVNQGNLYVTAFWYSAYQSLEQTLGLYRYDSTGKLVESRFDFNLSPRPRVYVPILQVSRSFVLNNELCFVFMNSNQEYVTCIKSIPKYQS